MNKHDYSNQHNILDDYEDITSADDKTLAKIIATTAATAEANKDKCNIGTMRFDVLGEMIKQL